MEHSVLERLFRLPWKLFILEPFVLSFTCDNVCVVPPTLASTSPRLIPKLTVAKDSSIFLAFNWLISACRIESATLIKDSYQSTLFCSFPNALFCNTWFTPGISPGRS